MLQRRNNLIYGSRQRYSVYSVKARFFMVYYPLEAYRAARTRVARAEVDTSDMYMAIKVITGCDALYMCM